MQDLEQLRSDLLTWIASARTLEELDQVRVDALGRKGRVSGLMKGLGALEAEARKSTGAALNRLKDELLEAIAARRAELERAELETDLASQRIDVTLPVRVEPRGAIHPISQVTAEVVAIFAEMGFQVAEGPDIEDDFHNFSALNIPPEHPARQMHDTFYLGPEKPERMLLRTHTSPVQIRSMQSSRPPYRLIAPGRSYRCDSDMTHTPMFHQVEGLALDRTTHMGHLKGCLIDFTRSFFEVDDVPVRFRPSFFPFTEPSAEMDVACAQEGGQLKIGEGGAWMEILGCGMVHPKVLVNVGIDPEVYQGFAFGLGIERIAMLKYGISDIRTFFDSDLRWLSHYGFSPLEVPAPGGGLAR